MALIGADAPELGTYRGLAGVALLPDGTLVAVDRWAHTIQRFSAKGEHLGSWGGPGHGEGKFAFPGAVASAPDGTIWVHDSGNHRLQHFLSSGGFLRTLGLPGAPPEAAGNSPVAALAVLSDNSIVVTYDTPFGIRLARFSGGRWDTGWDRGAYREPVALATGRSGQLFVADRRGSVSVLDVAGQLVATLGTGQLVAPTGLAVTSGNELLVADRALERVLRFRPDGSVGPDEPLPGWIPTSLAGRATGQVAFAAAGTLAVRSSTGETYDWGEPVRIWDPRGVAVSSDGVVAVGDLTGGLRLMTEHGVPLAETDLGPDEIVDVAAYDENAIALPADAWSASVVAPDGRVVGSRSLPPNAGGYAGLDGAPQGGLALAGRDGTVRRLDGSDSQVAVWDGSGLPGGAFREPSDSALLAGGLAVAESDRVRLIDFAGSSQGSWPIPGGGPAPGGPSRRWIASDNNGTLWVTDGARVLQVAGEEPVLDLSTFGGRLTGLAARDELYVAEEQMGVHVYGEPGGRWTARAYPNRWLAGPPLQSWEARSLSYDWGDGPPADGLPADRFSVTFSQLASLPMSGQYRFTLECDGGARLWVGARLVIDA